MRQSGRGSGAFLHEAIRSEVPDCRATLVTLWATQLRAGQRLRPECVRWYPKHAATFSDALALVRRELWTSPAFAPSRPDRDVPKLSDDVISRLLLVACRPP